MGNKKKCAVCNGKGKIELLILHVLFVMALENLQKFQKVISSHTYVNVYFLNRKTCPLCGKKCHHDTPNKPKILLGPT